jgi:copper chaperone CopZ
MCVMMKKIFKLFFVFAISFSFAQNNTSLNLTIEGMHCAGGCAKMIENSLNQNEGISAAVDFQNSSAAIIYDSERFSKTEIVDMINGYRGGKFKASLPSISNKSDQAITCAKGKNCCQKTGKKDASCSTNDNKTSSSIFKRKNKKENSLTGMIPGHNGCTKSCCSSKK